MKLLILAALVAAVGHYALAAVLTVPAAARVGYRSAVRRSGVGMIRAGGHRLVRGRF